MKVLFPAETFVDGSGNAITNLTAIHNPSLTAVAGQPVRYWKLNGDLVEFMTPAERTAVDDALLLADLDNLADQADAVHRATDVDLWSMLGTVRFEVNRGRVFITTLFDEVNTLRTAIDAINVDPQISLPTIGQITPPDTSARSRVNLKNRYRIELDGVP